MQQLWTQSMKTNPHIYLYNSTRHNIYVLVEYTCTCCNVVYTINNCYAIEFKLEKRCVTFPYSCLSCDNLVISNTAKYCCENCYSTFGHNHNVRHYSHHEI